MNVSVIRKNWSHKVYNGKIKFFESGTYQINFLSYVLTYTAFRSMPTKFFKVKLISEHYFLHIIYKTEVELNVFHGLYTSSIFLLLVNLEIDSITAKPYIPLKS